MALGFFSRLKEGLTRSTQKLTEGITGITAEFKKRRLDDAALDELEDVLIAADLGTEVARRVIASFRRSRFGKEVTDEEIKQALSDELSAILEPVAQPLRLEEVSFATVRAVAQSVIACILLDALFIVVYLAM
jgi:fused signal recognition particle receptor